MKETIIEIKNLKYAYTSDKPALRGIDVTIGKGERIAVIGSNGAGKSTFFLNLNGVLTPDSGEIYFKGQKLTRDKKDLNTLRKSIGIVFQDADNQIIASTVMGEVSFGPMNLKLPREEVVRRVDEALEYMNITDFKDRPPHYLSGGEKKRITIADIIAMHSEVIVFDEPTAALDPLNAEMLEEVLEKLAAQEKTMLISTHDVDFAYRWAERALVFCDGQIIADAPPVEIFNDAEILRRANLKKPMMLEVYNAMVAKGMLPDDQAYPKDVAAFKHLLGA
ncbi:energy-coupling factor ABC transporter ATP-binding protein [Eubacterium limosum]|uniref:ABC transporter ATP-binding protein n=1 Tax=Eubacterium limosum TaxID=1736 RepID=A0ABT5UQ75_EUBLI|nr:energy-coupling factor ABC transporter ATP-binding protein [Eubacterium limosum]MCB6569929.1 energy-coupling factor ABC transporter ATP-binding protein [Eubacterium limosum]MDE1471107.1 energy-coupling factor ABC transporter ATP-binding protein [Eubacterium limosum]